MTEMGTWEADDEPVVHAKTFHEKLETEKIFILGLLLGLVTWPLAFAIWGLLNL